jgi:tetratricopeptide (TPR) repeat protein
MKGLSQRIRMRIILSFIVSSVCCLAAFAEEAGPAASTAEVSIPPKGTAVNIPEKNLKQQAADSDVATASASSASAPVSVTPSQEFVRMGWEASSQGNLKKLDELAVECLKLYGQQAKEQEAALTGFPARGKEENYRTLNDVATMLFIRAEANMNYGKREEAIAFFQEIIDNYRWAQAWDPRGWFWSVTEKSQRSIDVMTGKIEEAPDEPEKGLKTLPKLAFPGKADVIDYKRYGEFVKVGTPEYSYKINDPKSLSEAVGEAIYPNTGDLLKDPGYKEALAKGRLEGNHWDFVNTQDLAAGLYKWATAKEPYGIRLFYIGTIFEKSKMYYEAIKAYQAIVVHFPKTVGWTYWQTPWYPAQAAVAKIKYLIRIHPDLELKVKWMKIDVENGFDNDLSNDVFRTYPGIIAKKNYWDTVKEKLNLEQPYVKLGKVKQARGNGDVRLVQYDNGHWQLLVKGKPYLIKGMNYAPTKTGQSPDKGTLASWMFEDDNQNGLPDGPYDSWVDKNLNNQQDADEPIVGDFQLMKDMGVNTMRLYHQSYKINKDVLRDMYEKYGIRVIMGDFFGKYTLGSGASWFEGTDYENPTHQKNMMESVRKMVMEFKDEPYILMWILGNENNYGVASNADKKPASYFKFANDVAKMIKEIDPNHPVAICNGDTLFLDVFAKQAPEVDILAVNVYRGDYGFGALWSQVASIADRPVFISEYGAPAYAKHMTREQAEQAQADYLRGNWLDIETNSAGHADGVGNALGGVVFEWIDEWWKNYDPFYHDRKSDAVGPFPGGYYYEEWFGLVGQGNGMHSPFLRQLRKSYFTYQELWNKKNNHFWN